MIYIDPTNSKYFQGFASYVQSILNEPALISYDYSQQGLWILNFVSFKNGTHKKISGEYIAVQSEQMNVRGTPEYKEFLKNAKKVWDMEDGWRVGYSDYWRLEMEEAKDIDVLFYGLMNNRRREITDKIPGIVCVMDHYGSGIMKYVMRSKIVLSVHYYQNPMNDLARIAPLLSNKAFVIAEETADPWFNAQVGHLLIFEANFIPEMVRMYLQDPRARIKWQDRGYEFIKSIKPDVSI